MQIKDLLFALSELDFIGSVTDAADKACEILSQYTKTQKQDSNNIIGRLSGKADYTVMLDAHIDQVGFVVTNVDNNGFLTVSNAGGIDLRALPSRAVTVYGKEKITAVFCATPPHLAEKDVEYSDISEIKLDTALGEKAKDVVSVGDYVCFKEKCFELQNGLVAGRSFDDRAGVACLLEVARRLSCKELPINVVFSLSTGEELGLRGVRPAAFEIDPQEAIAIDVTFGDAPGVSSEESCELGKGGMIGISPTLDKSVSRKLANTAKQHNIPHGLEIMASKTGTNADMISVSREGVKTCTLSVPLRNMHSEVEVLDLADLSAVCDLLEKYILSGGVFND